MKSHFLAFSFRVMNNRIIFLAMSFHQYGVFYEKYGHFNMRVHMKFYVSHGRYSYRSAGIHAQYNGHLSPDLCSFSSSIRSPLCSFCNKFRIEIYEHKQTVQYKSNQDMKVLSDDISPLYT